MESLSRIPKVLSTIEDMKNNYDIEKVFANYKANVKKFIEAMKIEISGLINQYQSTIKKLRQQIQLLKEEKNTKNFVRSPQTSRFYGSPNTTIKGKTIDMMQSTRSNLATPRKNSKFDDELPLSTILNKRSNVEVSQFPEELMSNHEQMWELNQSKFQVASKRRKQREQQLRLFLESGNSNLNATLNQFIAAIGIPNSKNVDLQNEEEQQNEESKTNSKKEGSLNKSLGQICESLDTSFISNKSRKQTKKKEIKKMDELKKKQQQQEKTEKMLKDRGIKSLLQRLRSNVQSSPYSKPQPISASRLITGGQTRKTSERSLSKKGKIMFNPVPIDIGRRHLVTKSRQLSVSPDSRPQSILKRSSTVLSRSISTFSANNFTMI